MTKKHNPTIADKSASVEIEPADKEGKQPEKSQDEGGYSDRRCDA